MDENGSLLFINGSGADEEGAEFTGGGFTRIIHKGHEPDFANLILRRVEMMITSWVITIPMRALSMRTKSRRRSDQIQVRF